MLSPECNDGSIYASKIVWYTTLKIRNKNYTIISIYAEKRSIGFFAILYNND